MTTIKKDQFSSQGHAQASCALVSLPHVTGSPEANRSRDSMDWTPASFITMRKQKKNPYFFTFLF